jgi:hypothetical protein
MEMTGGTKGGAQRACRYRSRCDRDPIVPSTARDGVVTGEVLTDKDYSSG